MSTADCDDDLYEMVLSLLREQNEASRPNRRDNQRYSFPCVQLLAPYDGECLPGPEQLRQVLCHDLSPSGFSFLAYTKPETPQVIAALGPIPLQFFVAEIMHVRPTLSSDGHEFHVGCRFLRRLVNSKWREESLPCSTRQPSGRVVTA